MSRTALGLLVLLAGCTWSNSLYQARLLSGEALQAERDHHTGEAEGFWGQVVAKGDSAYARSPRGKRGAEAEWLRGRALARTRDCGDAVTAFDVALVAAPTAHWREPLLLELARCKEILGDLSAAADFSQLATSRDTAIRREARLHAAHNLVRAGRGQDALTMLGDADGVSARIDRAEALIALGRTAAALADLSPLLAAADTSVPWANIVGSMAATDTPRTDTLLAAIDKFPHVLEERRASWLLAAMRGALGRDSLAAANWLTELLRRPPGRSVYDARGYAELHDLAAVADPRGLAVLVDSLKAVDEGDNGGSLPAIHAQAVRDQAARILAANDATRAGAPQGDLMLFALAEQARDSLGARGLAAALFQRIEREWAESPYVPKTLLARIALEPDSATALRQRFAGFSSNPYVAHTRGVADPHLMQLEDSLDAFVRTLARQAAPSATTVPPSDRR